LGSHPFEETISTRPVISNIKGGKPEQMSFPLSWQFPQQQGSMVRPSCLSMAPMVHMPRREYRFSQDIQGAFSAAGMDEIQSD